MVSIFYWGCNARGRLAVDATLPWTQYLTGKRCPEKARPSMTQCLELSLSQGKRFTGNSLALRLKSHVLDILLGKCCPGTVCSLMLYFHRLNILLEMSGMPSMPHCRGLNILLTKRCPGKACSAMPPCYGFNSLLLM